MDEHLPIALLIDLLTGVLPEEQTTATRQHLKDCPNCRLERLRLEHVLVQMRHLGQTYPPHSTAWNHAFHRTTRLATRKQRIVTDLLFDSHTSPAPIGFRSISGADHQQLFTCEPYLVDLRCKATSDPFPITGQLLGPTTTGTAVLVLPDYALEQPLSDLGEFQFAAVPAGKHSLFLLVADEMLLFPSLTVKA